MRLRFVPFVPGRRPTDEDVRRGFGSSDSAAVVTHDGSDNRAVLLYESVGLPRAATLEATVAFDGEPLPGWDRRPIPRAGRNPHRLELRPNEDLATIDLGFTGGFLRKAKVELRAIHQGEPVATATAWLDVCDAAVLGSLYQRILERVVAPDAARQSAAAGVEAGAAYHPWFPVLTIGADKAALYTEAVLADVVGKQHHLTDPAWLLRVGAYLELLTALGIAEALRDDVGDILEPVERAAYETADAFAEIRRRIQPEAWREGWQMRRIAFPGLGTPRTGPVSVLNLLKKRDATLRFMHVHHDDLKHAIELAGPNLFNAQETWQRVFRDAERAVMRKTVDAFPELGFLPPPVREIVLWQRLEIAGQQGVYATACSQYRTSMNAVAEWAKSRGLMDYAGPECVPPDVSLITAYTRDRAKVAVLQRQDGFGPRLDIHELVVDTTPTTDEIEDMLSQAPILGSLSPAEVHQLALAARPLLLGPTQRFVVEGLEGTSLFLIGAGHVEVRLRTDDGGDWLADTMGPGEIVGEMALLTGERRTATVRSVSETVIYEIGRQQYEPVLKAHPELRDELIAVMDDRLARRAARLAAESQAEADKRWLPGCAAVLARWLRRAGIA